jgi:predicted 3-demethylubiquinone-9 3-methyltransferase (glyoxalase superfamily)
MPPNNYGFSEWFCWVADKYGVTWQLNLAAPA